MKFVYILLLWLYIHAFNDMCGLYPNYENINKIFVIVIGAGIIYLFQLSIEREYKEYKNEKISV